MISLILITFLITRWCFFKFNKKKIKHCKTCIVLGSGGHTAEMIQLIKGLDFINYSPRSYIIADTDTLSETKALEYEQSVKKGEYAIYKIPRTREIGQSLKTVPWTISFALLKSSKIFIQTWPDLILSNGPGSCLPLCMLALLARVLGLKKIEIIYVESFARVQDLSLTGKLLYPFVDRFLVQWPELAEKYRGAEYQGILV